jgi:multiple sugar transport system substrate-binding protein
MLSAAACSPGGTDGGDDGDGGVDFTTQTGEITAWAFPNADDVGTSRLDYVAALLPDITANMDATNFDSQKFTTQIASGQVADVVQMDRRLVTTYAAQGLIMPLDACYEAVGVDPSTEYYSNVVADVTYDGHIWGVPQFFQPPAIIVNNRIAEAAGVSPEDFNTSDLDTLLAAIEATYQEVDGVPTVAGFDPQAHSNTELWVLALGGQLEDASGAPTLDNAANVAAFEWLKAVYDAQGGYAVLKSFTDTFDFFGEQNQYVADQVAAELNMQWYPNVLSPYMDQIDTRTVPVLDYNGDPFAVTGGQAFVIPVGAANPGAACAWAVNLTTTDAWWASGEARAATRAADGAPNTGLFTGNPAADQAIRDEWVKPSGNAGFDQTVQGFYDVVAYGTSFGSSPAGETIKAELSAALISYLLGEKTAEQALSDAQAAAITAYNDITAG